MVLISPVTRLDIGPRDDNTASDVISNYPPARSSNLAK